MFITLHQKHMIEPSELRKLLEELHLYKEYLIVKETEPDSKCFVTPFNLIGKTFDHYCENESNIKTFKLTLPEIAKDYYGDFSRYKIPTGNLNSSNQL